MSLIPATPDIDAASPLGPIPGLGGSTAKKKGPKKASKPVFPWDKKKVKSTFFNYVKIEPSRWDQLFPYRLMVIDSTNNQVVGGTPDLKITVIKGTGSSTINFQKLGKPWILNLPITPQQLNITDQFAIATSATLKGILEEHSGVRFKIINASGSMGVWPFREAVEEPAPSPNPLSLEGVATSFFGGTIAAAKNVAAQAKSVFNSVTSNHPVAKPISKRPVGAKTLSTGYYHAMALQQFLEQYAEAKKDPKHASWRLVFDIPKQNQSFVCTPMQFNWQQSAAKPMEIMYNFQLKAWRRIDIGKPPKQKKANNQQLNSGILQRALAAISAARRTLSAVLDLIGAVRSDVTAPLEVLRQTSLFVKDIVGIAFTVADLPFQIAKDYSSAVKQSINNITGSIARTSSDPAVRSSLTAIASSSAATEGLSMDAVAKGQLGKSAALAQSIDPANNVFAKPEANFALMDSVPLSGLVLTDVQQFEIDQIIEDARAITVDDLKQFRSVILGLSLQLSNNFGAGDSYFSTVFGKPTPNTRIQPMTLDEFSILKDLYDVVQAYDILTATSEVDDSKKQTNMEYIAGLSDQSGVPFDVPGSKVLVPVPFGLTIEGIASRYLGDPQAWLEIATLNNLRAPYIDENGFTLPLLSNATGRQITVGSIENLYVGQRVVINSSTQSPAARVILGLDRLSDTSFLITLDGLPDLDSYLLSEKAYLQAYLPGTVNSQQKIFIPSAQDAPDDSNITPPASVSKDPLVGMSQVDWLLTDEGDVAVNSYGDFRYAAGMTNIIQALKIKFGSQKGKWLLHPEFGLDLAPGFMNSDFTAEDIYDSINELVTQDPRFQEVSGLEIDLTGPTLQISLAVTLAGQEGIFPLTFDLAS